MNDEDIPYRSAIPETVVADTKFSKDEEQEPTLRRVYKLLKDGVDDLGRWNAFDLTETELKLKQQIKAHQIAASILEPALDAVTQALATVDENFRQRNQK